MKKKKQSNLRGKKVYVQACQDEESEQYEEERKPLLEDWELINFDQDGMVLKLKFRDPLDVSQRDRPDLLLLQLDLSEYKDYDDLNLPPSLVKYVEIPPQMPDDDSQGIKISAEISSSATVGIIGSKVLLNILVSASMD